MVKAMNLKVGNPLRKLVLIKLADNANDNGECFPSHNTIAKACEISRSSVQAHIEALIKMGVVKKINRKKNEKENTSNLYILTIPADGIGGIPEDNTPIPTDNRGVPAGGIGGIPTDEQEPIIIESVNEPIIEPIIAEKPQKPKRACQLPDDFKPNDHHQEIAQAENINLESEFIKFKDYCLATGKKYIDWDAGFNNWLRNAGKFSKQKTPQKQPFMTRSERNMAVLNSMRGQ